jgi:RNA polymerase sigma-70 factor (ECF subfamily)
LSWDLHELFRSHAAEIVRALRRRGLSAETAADIAQDAFLRVLSLGPVEGTAIHNPKAYLHQVSRNLSINHIRRERLVSMVELDEAVAEQVADPAPNPETIVYDRQRLRQTEAALAELPERTRHAFALYRLGDHTITEVAQQIGLSTTRTWTLIREAYRHIVLRTGGI